MLCELFLNKRTVLKEPKTRKGRCTSFFYLVILQLRKSSKFCHKRMLCDPFVVFFNFFALLTCQQKAPTFLKKRTLCDPFIKRTLLKERLSVYLYILVSRGYIVVIQTGSEEVDDLYGAEQTESHAHSK